MLAIVSGVLIFVVIMFLLHTRQKPKFDCLQCAASQKTEAWEATRCDRALSLLLCRDETQDGNAGRRDQGERTAKGVRSGGQKQEWTPDVQTKGAGGARGNQETTMGISRSRKDNGALTKQDHACLLKGAG